MTWDALPLGRVAIIKPNGAFALNSSTPGYVSRVVLPDSIGLDPYNNPEWEKLSILLDMGYALTSQ